MIAGLILLQGWWMAVNASAIYDSTFHLFVPVACAVPAPAGLGRLCSQSSPGCFVRRLLGAVCLVAELAQRPVWLLRLWYALARRRRLDRHARASPKGDRREDDFLAAASGSVGCHTFFASYFYHANAGAFLNLILPVVAGLALWTVARFRQPIPTGGLGDDAADRHHRDLFEYFADGAGGRAVA